MRKYLVATAVVGIMALAAPALAAWNFDPATGTGFVGKGDVQEALGLNNAQVQAASLAFTYTDSVTYDVPCRKDLEKKTMRNDFKRNSSLSATVAYDARQKKQITGFILTGFGAQSIDGNIECPGGWEADGDPVLVEASGGVLSVNDVPLPVPAPEPLP